MIGIYSCESHKKYCVIKMPIDVMAELAKISPEIVDKQKFYLNMSRTIILQNGLKEDIIDKFEEIKNEFSDIYKESKNLFNQIARDLLIFGLGFINTLDESWDNEVKNALKRIKIVKERIAQLKERGDW